MKFLRAKHESVGTMYQKQALLWYLVSLLVLCLGIVVAAWHYPSGYDWSYTVVSSLASQKKNPAGSAWFAGALSLSMVLLWLYVSTLKYSLLPSLTLTSKFAIGALRLGMICGALVGVERLLMHDLSAWIYKGHELIALLAFLGLYIGVLGLLFQLMLRRRIYALPALMIASPLVAIGITQFWLYIDQRDLGWVNTSWREMGIPLWLSFAFWQWLAVGLLMLGLGLLLITFGKEKKTTPN